MIVEFLTTIDFAQKLDHMKTSLNKREFQV